MAHFTQNPPADNITKMEIEKTLREELADLEHQQWASWTDYFLNNIVDKKDGLIRLDLVNRWRKQIKTPYKDLSEKEKDSDREWADKSLKIFNRWKKQFIEEILEKIDKKFGDDLMKPIKMVKDLIKQNAGLE